jgi:hypothetical protein
MYSPTLDTAATDHTNIFSWRGLPFQYSLTDPLSAAFATNDIYGVATLTFLYLFAVYLVLPFITTLMISSLSSLDTHTIVYDKVKVVATVSC